MAQRVHGVAGLKKYDIKVSGIVFMLYCLVAAGAFGIEEMIPQSGPGITLIMLILFPFIWSYPISNMVAECASMMPREGGVYVWAKEAFGEFWGFQAGWARGGFPKGRLAEQKGVFLRVESSGAHLPLTAGPRVLLCQRSRE